MRTLGIVFVIAIYFSWGGCGEINETSTVPLPIPMDPNIPSGFAIFSEPGMSVPELSCMELS